MDKSQVKEYVSKYKNSYSKESIEKQLLNSGALKQDIDEAYGALSGHGLPSSKINKKKGLSGLAIFFIVIFILIILSVGIGSILMYSFVDFGTLLPNKVELSNNLRASSIESFASSLDGNVLVVFTFTGVKRTEIQIDGSEINNIMEKCSAINVKNIDTLEEVTDGGVAFLNGQTGVITFKCEQLIENDIIEGDITVMTVNPKNAIELPSSGYIRLNVKGGK